MVSGTIVRLLWHDCDTEPHFPHVTYPTRGSVEVFEIAHQSSEAEYVIAKYDFTGESEEEVNLKIGQIYIVREKEAEWWR